MNFEELLDSRNGTAMRKEQMPFGMLYKKIKDNKYENVLDLRHELTDSLVFCDAIQRESEQRQQHQDSRQVAFTVVSDSAGVYGVSIKKGSFRTFEHLIEETPAVVAGKNFVENTIDDLLDATGKLHQQDVFHLCFAPSNVLTRRSDNAVMLLFHGSNYQRMGDYRLLYPGCEDYLAPELAEGAAPDAACDVYSLGRFIQYLCKASVKTPELVYIAKKATQPDPSKRFQSVADMKRQLLLLRRLRRGALAVAGVAALLLVGLFAYNSFVPQKEDIEFVNAPAQTEEDILAPTIDPDMEYGLFSGYKKGDTLTEEQMAEREQQQKELDAKAEEIFRKQFTRDAERILTQLYSSDRMSSGEQTYMEASQQSMQELVRAQTEIAQRAGLSDTRAQLIASQVIEQISARKKAQMAARSAATLPAAGKQGAAESSPLGSSSSASSASRPSTTIKDPADAHKERVQRERQREEREKVLLNQQK